ncbi:hypothetical protein HWV62_18076 [Athelia sp. TMB]|nr:hypothetical protein HWV62_18076 [Athelia sp. TMB]
MGSYWNGAAVMPARAFTRSITTSGEGKGKGDKREAGKGPVRFWTAKNDASAVVEHPSECCLILEDLEAQDGAGDGRSESKSHPANFPSFLPSMSVASADEKSPHYDGDQKQAPITVDIAATDAIHSESENTALDLIHAAKARILNDALAEIGINKYRWILFNVVGFGWLADDAWPIVTGIILTQVVNEFDFEGPWLILKYIWFIAQKLGLLVGAVFWGVGSEPNYIVLSAMAACCCIGVGGNLPVDALCSWSSSRATAHPPHLPARLQSLTGIFILASTTACTSAALLVWNYGYSFTSNVIYGVLYALSHEVLPTRDCGTGNALVGDVNRMFGVMAPIIALYASLRTSVPIFISGAIFFVVGVLALLLSFEPRRHSSL